MSGWNNMQVVNSFITGFGEGFDKFDNEQLVTFCKALSSYGLKQEDIFQSVLEQISEKKLSSNHFKR